MLIKKVFNWNDERYDKLLCNDDGDFKNGVKAFGIGALEGFIDAAAVVGAVVIAKDTIESTIWVIKKIAGK